MELVVIFFTCWVCYALFFNSGKKKSSTHSPPASIPSTQTQLRQRSVSHEPLHNEDELVTFTITTSYSDQEQESKNKTKGRWVSTGEIITIAGHQIHGGFFYLGGHMPSSDGYSTESSLVDSSLPVFKDAEMLFEDESLGYWPKFNRLSKSARGAYLRWLASDRSHPGMPVGYVFIYFYGLERRVLVDAKKGEVSDEEYLALYNEIKRLRSIYSTNRSFAGYSLRLMELMALLRPGVVLFEEENEQRYDSLLFRYQLAVRVSKGEPVPAHLALSWLKAYPEYTLRTPARRCANEFTALFKQQYTEQFGQGMVVKPNKTRLSLHYYPASSSLSDYTVKQPDLPDPSVLKAPAKKLVHIAEKCTEALSGYSRYLGKKDTSSSDIGALLLLPDTLLDEDTNPFFKQFKQFKQWAAAQISSETKGLVAVADFWKHTGTPLPARINKKETELIFTLASKAGYGIAPDSRYHHTKTAIDGHLVLFEGGHGPHFDPSRAFNEIGVALRLGAMVAGVDGNVDSAELETLRNLIDHDPQLSPTEKRSLHAYLYWRLNTPANMAGLKARLEKLGEREKEAVRHILVGVALADCKVDPSEIKQLEKLYTALGLDKTQVTSDVHQLTSSKPALKDKVPTSAPVTQRTPTFNLDSDVLALHESETDSVQSLLGSIFAEDEEPQEQPVAKEVESAATAKGLDDSHRALFDQLITKESWDRKEVLAACDSLKLMLEGALETINDWAYEQVDAPLIDDDEAIYIDLEIANELTTAG